MSAIRTRLATVVGALALGAIGLAAPAAAATSGATGATGTSGTSAAPSAHAAACDRAPWQSKVQGFPHGFGPGARSGVYLWHSSTGFHLRVTHWSHTQRVYTGVVHASGPMRIDPARLEKGDRVVLSKDRRTFEFAFVNHGYIDGVNFHTDCAKYLTVSRLHVGNENLSTGHVFLGHDKQHPHHIPFRVQRSPMT